MSEAVPKKGIGSLLIKGALIVVGILIGITALGAIVGDKESGSTAPAAQSEDKSSAQTSNAVETEPASKLTGPQQNAVRSAEQYIAMTGFSRKGLIDQLASDYGDGYEVSDATVAVDSLPIDWNEQAARSAEQYLRMSGFSCKGLIEQLSSSYGDKYTKSQATYGAQQAGAC